MYEYIGTGYVIPVNNVASLNELIEYFVNNGKLQHGNDINDAENNNLCGDWCDAGAIHRAELNDKQIDYGIGLLVIRDWSAPQDIDDISKILTGHNSEDYFGDFLVLCDD